MCLHKPQVYIDLSAGPQYFADARQCADTLLKHKVPRLEHPMRRPIAGWPTSKIAIRDEGAAAHSEENAVGCSDSSQHSPRAFT